MVQTKQAKVNAAIDVSDDFMIVATAEGPTSIEINYRPPQRKRLQPLGTRSPYGLFFMGYFLACTLPSSGPADLLSGFVTAR
jgi:hypothetical protein